MRTRYPNRWHPMEPAEHCHQCEDRDPDYVDPEDDDGECICELVWESYDE